MSSEIGSEYYEIIKIGRKCHSSCQTVLDRGISYINSEWTDSDDSEMFLASKPKNELLQFHKDPDYDDEEFKDFNYGSAVVEELKDSEFDSLLPYDFETDIVDKLNLDKQIESYAANLWEFVSIVGDTILFKKPRSI